jgi:hypothetical protein
MDKNSMKYHNIRYSIPILNFFDFLDAPCGQMFQKNFKMKVIQIFKEFQVSQYVNDFHEIDFQDGNEKRKITVKDVNKIHQEELKFLKNEIQKAKMNKEVVVVLTHYAPLTIGTSFYEGKRYKSVISSEATNLKSMMGNPLFLWAFGHTHFTSCQNVKGTIVQSNQVGYHKEKEKYCEYDSMLIVEIPDKYDF